MRRTIVSAVRKVEVVPQSVLIPVAFAGMVLYFGGADETPRWSWAFGAVALIAAVLMTMAAIGRAHRRRSGAGRDVDLGPLVLILGFALVATVLGGAHSTVQVATSVGLAILAVAGIVGAFAAARVRRATDATPENVHLPA